MFAVGIFTTIFFVYDSIKQKMKLSDIIGTTLCGLLPVCIIFGLLAYRLLRNAKKDRKSVNSSASTVKQNNEMKNQNESTVNTSTELSQTTYVLTNNEIYRADGKSIEDSDVPHLIELSKQRALEYEQNSNNPKFHRTEAEKELSFQFSQHYGTESTKLCNIFTNLNHNAYEADSITEKIELLKQAIDAFETAKQWHYNKSKGGMIYFQDFYEYMHNSQNECFSWVDHVKQNLSELEYTDNFIIPWITEKAKNGFLQTDIYKAFPKDDKSYLRNIIKQLIDGGYLTSQKQGRTYLITATNKQYKK